MTSTNTSLIIGGGIAGPAMAMALQKAGIESVVYEARSETGSADGVGAFLTLASNGLDALRTLGADELAIGAGFPTPSITLRSCTGKHLGKSSTGWTLPDGGTSQTIKRSDLYQALHYEAVNRHVRFEHGKRFVSADMSRDGVRVVFDDGTDAVGSALIGCDGVHSSVRRAIDPSAPDPTYLGLITVGGYARGVGVDTTLGSYEMIFGKRAFFGYAQAPDGEVWWFANLPWPCEPARGEVEAIPTEEWRTRLLQLYSDDAGPACSLIGATQEIMTASPIHALPHLPMWHRDRMVVIGDAAHAPSPTSGQGASLSIEDAVVLAKCMRDVPTLEGAFDAFERLRRPRAERIIKWAARMNNSKTAGPVGRVIRDAMMPTFMRMAANSRSVRDNYSYHIDWTA